MLAAGCALRCVEALSLAPSSLLSLSLLDGKRGWMIRPLSPQLLFVCAVVGTTTKTMFVGRKFNKKLQKKRIYVRTAFFLSCFMEDHLLYVLLLPIGSEKSRAGRTLENQHPLGYILTQTLSSLRKRGPVEAGQAAQVDLLGYTRYEREVSLSPKNLAIFVFLY